VIVIDGAQRVRVWNATSEDLWGLRADEVEGCDFRELDIGLPIRELEDAVAQTLDGSSGRVDRQIEAVNRRGQALHCVVRVMALRTRASEIYGSMILTSPTSDE
jgi:two-component system, chemotaxis family, CheB/CheR fusion protein